MGSQRQGSEGQSGYTGRRWSWSNLTARNIETFETQTGPNLGPFTEWAKKYGQTRDPTISATGQNFSPRRSGLSPQNSSLEPLSPIAWAKRNELDRFEINELSMKSRDLRDLDIVEAKDLKCNNLDNEICPVFDKSRWNLGDDPQTTAPWNVHHGPPELWLLLQPILRLASMFLTSPAMIDWWDALAFGPLTPIESPRAPPGITLYSLDTRRPEVRSNIQPIPWKDLSNQIAWSFSNGSNNRYGYTILEGGRKKNPGKPEERFVRMWVSFKLILPLLGNLTESERLVQNFSVAYILVHELCHCIWDRNTNLYVNHGGEAPDESFYISWEPYFREHSVSELGEAMESMFWEGKFYSIIRDPREELLKKNSDRTARGIPWMGLLQRSWPNYQDLESTTITGWRRPPLLDKEKWEGHLKYIEKWVPVTWCEEIQQKQFWNICINKYGGDFAKPFPLMRGVVYEKRPSRKSDPRSEVLRTTSHWMDRSFEEYPKHMFNRKASQRQQGYPEMRHDRIARAIIRQKLREDGERRRTRLLERHTTIAQWQEVARWQEARDIRRAEMGSILLALGDQE